MKKQVRFPQMPLLWQSLFMDLDEMEVRASLKPAFRKPDLNTKKNKTSKK